MTAIFGPDSLTASYCRDIVTRLYPKLPLELRGQLDEEVEQLQASDQDRPFIDFLINRGRPIWLLFLDSIGAPEPERDFLPLREPEREQLHSDLDTALVKPGQGWFTRNSQAIRFTTALALLALGIGGLVLLLTRLPTLATEFFKETQAIMQKQGLGAELTKTTNEMKQLGWSEQARTISRLRELLESATGPIEEWRKGSEKLNLHASRLGASAASVTAAENLMKDGATTLKTKEAWFATIAAGAENKPPARDGVLDVLTKILKSLEGGGPGALKTAVKKARAARDENTRATAFAELARLVEDESTKLEVAEADKKLLTSLHDGVKELSGASKKIEVATTQITNQAKAITTVVAQLTNTTWKELAQKYNGLLSSLGTATDSIRRSHTQFEKSGKILTDLESATAGIQSLADFQSKLAFQGGSPAIILILALCGMFSVFGLTSLIRWVRVLELERQENLWRNRTKSFTGLAAALVGQGINPTRIMEVLRTDAPTDGKPAPTPPTPIGTTLTEIARSLKKQ